MTYREQLETAKEHNLDILDLTIAIEVDVCFGHYQGEKVEPPFEQVCEFVKYIYLKSERTLISDIVDTIQILIDDEEYSWDDILSMSKWDFLQQVADYFPY